MSALAAPVIPFPAGSLLDLQDHLEALFESLEGLEDAAQRAECEADIDLYLAAEIRKVDSIAGYIARCEAEQRFAAEEAKRLTDRKKQWERRQERLETYVQRVMDLWGMTKLEGRTSTLQLRACPASVEILDQTIVPQEYLRVTVTEAVDKTAAKKALQAGESVPGLQLVTTKHTVVRK